MPQRSWSYAGSSLAAAAGGSVLMQGIADCAALSGVLQANVSRSKAVKALKAADGDIVSAIMELTM